MDNTFSLQIVQPDPLVEPTNVMRACRIDVIFAAYSATKGEAEHSIEAIDQGELSCLLADIRHWCDRQNIDIYQALTWSYQHYLEERAIEKTIKGDFNNG